MSFTRVQESLQKLGLTGIEARVYIYLLQSGSVTGYKIGRGLGIPAANVYRSLDTLHTKGAVILEDGDKRLCKAVPLEELLINLEHQFNTLKDDALDALTNLEVSQVDQHVYHIASPEAVFERFYRMLEMASDIVLLDIFPKAANKLKSNIEATAKRGVKTIVKLYEPLSIPGAHIIAVSGPKKNSRRWHGVWANGVVDGRQNLKAYLSEDMRQVHQAIWTDNVYASWIYHSALAYELMWAHATRSTRNGNLKNSMIKIEKGFLTGKIKNAPGYHQLIEMYERVGSE